MASMTPGMNIARKDFSHEQSRSTQLQTPNLHVQNQTPAPNPRDYTREAKPASVEAWIYTHEPKLHRAARPIYTHEPKPASVEAPIYTCEPKLHLSAHSIRTLEAKPMTVEARICTHEAKLHRAARPIYTHEAKPMTVEARIYTHEPKPPSIETRICTLEPKSSSVEVPIYTGEAKLRCAAHPIRTHEPKPTLPVLRVISPRSHPSTPPRPVRMKKLPTRLVDAFISMGAKKIALGLQQIRRQPRSAEAIIKRKSSRERRRRHAIFDRLNNRRTPSPLIVVQHLGKEIINKQIRKLRILVVSLFDLSKEPAANNAPAAPHQCDSTVSSNSSPVL